MSDCFPELLTEIAPIRHDFFADGELVVLDEQGRPIWERLHGRHRLKDPAKSSTHPKPIQPPSLRFIFYGSTARTFGSALSCNERRRYMWFYRRTGAFATPATSRIVRRAVEARERAPARWHRSEGQRINLRCRTQYALAENHAGYWQSMGTSTKTVAERKKHRSARIARPPHCFTKDVTGLSRCLTKNATADSRCHSELPPGASRSGLPYVDDVT